MGRLFSEIDNHTQTKEDKIRNGEPNSETYVTCKKHKTENEKNIFPLKNITKSDAWFCQQKLHQNEVSQQQTTELQKKDDEIAALKDRVKNLESELQVKEKEEIHYKNGIKVYKGQVQNNKRHVKALSITKMAKKSTKAIISK